MKKKLKNEIAFCELHPMDENKPPLHTSNNIHQPFIQLYLIFYNNIS